MTIIVFLIDNSLSMCQRTYLGTSLLDIAKGCVEDIFKIRLKFSRSDRYYIFSLDSNGIKSAECKQNIHAIRAALNNIKPNSHTTLGVGVRRTFDMLNLMRMSNGLENYGMGRYPSQIEHAIVVCITDGENATSELGSFKGNIALPVLDCNAPGCDYTIEPFRWDYRFYSIVLRIPAFPALKMDQSKFIPTDENCPIREMCEVTGGRAYKISNERTLHQCLESLSQKCHPGVVLHFRKLEDPADNNPNPPPWYSCKKMIYVKSSSLGTVNSHWPIPEPYWLDETVTDGLQPRTAHPHVCFSTQRMSVPKIMEHFPVDRYELEPSPLTQYLLEKHDNTFVWHCYVPKSGKIQDYPFGYLRASPDLQSVHLYVLSYNFISLLELLHQALEPNKVRSHNDNWGGRFAHFLAILPKYYFGPLSRAMERLALGNIIKAESVDRVLPYTLKSQLQKLRQTAKIALDKDQKEILLKPSNIVLHKRSLLKRKHQVGLNDDICMVTPVAGKIPRLEASSYLMSNVDRRLMRTMMVRGVKNFRGCVQGDLGSKRVMERERLHEQPMAEMGDYANYKFDKMPEPLRELIPAPERKETFGNPFRRKTSTSNSIVNNSSSGNGPFNGSSNALGANNNNASTNGNAIGGGISHGINSFEADERFVEDMLSGGIGSSTNTLSPKRSSSPSSDIGRRKGRLPLNITYYNWRKTPSNSPCSSASSSPNPTDTYFENSGNNGHKLTPSLNIPVTIDSSYNNQISLHNGIVDSSLNQRVNNNGVPFVSPISPCSPKIHELSINKQSYFHNRVIMKKLVTILRHPKIDGEKVFQLLKSFQGTYKLQKVMISTCLQTCVQFKRFEIMKLIEQYLNYLKQQHQNQKHNGSVAINKSISNSEKNSADNDNRDCIRDNNQTINNNNLNNNNHLNRNYVSPRLVVNGHVNFL